MNLSFFFFSLLFVSTSLFSDELVSYDYEADIYYSNLSIFLDLDPSHEITNAQSKSELDIYSELFLNTFHPNIFLAEMAIHPMPILGLYFRQNNEEVYNKAIIDDFNIVKAMTAGFEEPYSLSFFVGRMIVFNKEGEEHIGKNRAYMGWLVSIGDYSIKDNSAHYDKWANIEFKLKGTRERNDKDLDWSFRLGSQLHDNHDFTDTFYIGARRSSIDYKKSIWSFIYNSAFSTMLEVSADTFELTGAEIAIEKKIPLKYSAKMAFGLEIGFLYNSGARYRGSLKDEGINNYQLIFRPNLKF